MVGNFVYLLGFGIESYYCMTLGYVLFVVFNRFVYMVRNNLVDRKDLIDQCSNYCFADLYCLVVDFDDSILHLRSDLVDS